MFEYLKYPMIIAEDPVARIPAGQSLVGVRGKRVQQKRVKVPLLSAVEGTSSDDADHMLNSFASLVGIKDDQEPEIIRLRSSAGDEPVIEQLYVSGKVATITSLPAGVIQRKFTAGQPIRNGFWYSFSSEAPATCPKPSRVAPALDAVCLLTKDSLQVHSEVGQEQFFTDLPFEMNNVWPTQHGLLLERKVETADVELGLDRTRLTINQNDELSIPVLFTLAHPLNELLPVIMRDREDVSSARYANDGTMQVVFACADTPVVLMYSNVTGLHSIWLVNKASHQDGLVAAQRQQQRSLCNSTALYSLNGPTPNRSMSTLSTPATGTKSQLFSQQTSTPSSLSVNRFSSTPRTSLISRTQTTSNSNNYTTTSFNTTRSTQPTTMTSTASSSQLGANPSIQLTPSITPVRRIATRSITRVNQSPSAAAALSPVVSLLMRLNRVQYNRSNEGLQASPKPSCSSVRTAIQARSLHNAVASTTRQNNGSSSYLTDQPDQQGLDGGICWPAQELIPDVCLQCVWTENTKRNEQVSSSTTAAKRVFMAEDFLGQKYLCYLIEEEKQLRCLKITQTEVVSGDTDAHLEQRVIASSLTVINNVLDAQTVQGKTLIVDTNNSLNVYCGVTPIGPLFINATRDDSSYSSSSVYGRNVDGMLPVRMSSSRHSPSKAHTPAKTVSLSPVTFESGSCLNVVSSSGLIQSLGPATGRSVVLNLSTGESQLYPLPKLAESKIVWQCLQCITSVLPRERALHLNMQWYVRCYAVKQQQAMCDLAELRYFSRFILDQMGVNVSILSFMNEHLDSEAIGTPSCKRRREERQATDEDFEHFLSLCSDESSEPLSKPASTVGDESCSVDTTASLYQHAAAVMQALNYSLHELYMYRQTAIPDCRRHLTRTLHFIAWLFGWNEYCAMYRLQYPDVVADVESCSIQRITEEQRQKLTIPRGFSPEHPASIETALSNLLQLLPQHQITGKSGSITSSPLHPPLQRDALRLPVLPLCHGTSRTSYVAVALALLSGACTCVSDMERLIGRNWTYKLASVTGIGEDVMEEVLIDKVFADRTMTPAQRASAFLVFSRMNMDVLRTMPPGIACILIDIMYTDRKVARPIPQSLVTAGKPNASGQVTTQTGLDAIIVQLNDTKHNKPEHKSVTSSDPSDGGTSLTDVGLEALDDALVKRLLELRYPNDLRVRHMRRMLDSSKPICVSLKQQPGQSDGEHREQKEAYLLNQCIKACTQPLGRAMVTLCTIKPLVTQPVPMPDLCLHGRVPPRNLRIDLNTQSETNFDWAHFHNGVAAGLQFVSHATHANKLANRYGPEPRATGMPNKSATSDDALDVLNAAWIVYNVPQASSPLSTKDAGFLFGLGLNGHLATLNLFHMHEYLVRGEQFTSIAVLLGIAASKLGTADVNVQKMLATHLLFLLPPTYIELQIDGLVQTAAVLGVGMLFAETSHSSLADALLREMTRPPTADNDPWLERDAYVLACGMSLGFVALGHGAQVNAMAMGQNGQSLCDRLFTLMSGGIKQDWCVDSSHSSSAYYTLQTGHDKVSSELVRESSRVNVNVTSPGATLAVAMMYMKTGDTSVADRLQLPNTINLLDHIRPDFCMLRVMARGIVLWDGVCPTKQWMEDQVPSVISRWLSLVLDTAPDARHRLAVDCESVCQVYVQCLTGAAIAIALRFAGSSNQTAFATLVGYLKMFMKCSSNLSEYAGQWTMSTARNTLIICIGMVGSVTVKLLKMVMAGTGNLDVMRLVRYFRSRRHRVGSAAAASKQASENYANYMAAHMALGMLFIGGGRYTLSTSNIAVASMICAFYPRFPTTLDENRQYLQAFRHLWVLAAEPRCVIPVDVESKSFTSVHLDVTFKDTVHYQNVRVEQRAPCLLPELTTLSSVRVNDTRYWPIIYDLEDLQQLHKLQLVEQLVVNNGQLSVMRRAGFLSYEEDDAGYKSTCTLALMRKHCWQPVLPVSEQQDTFSLTVNSVRHWCTKQECMDALPFLLDVFAGICNTDELDSRLVLDANVVWQLVLLKQMVERGYSYTLNMECMRRLQHSLVQYMLRHKHDLNRGLRELCSDGKTRCSHVPALIALVWPIDVTTLQCVIDICNTSITNNNNTFETGLRLFSALHEHNKMIDPQSSALLAQIFI